MASAAVDGQPEALMGQYVSLATFSPAAKMDDRTVTARHLGVLAKKGGMWTVTAPRTSPAAR